MSKSAHQIFKFCATYKYVQLRNENFGHYCQCHDINSKTTFTLITLFFTLVMFLSFWQSKIVICGIITGRQHIKAMI
jgi:hypothetical protein